MASQRAGGMCRWRFLGPGLLGLGVSTAAFAQAPPSPEPAAPPPAAVAGSAREAELEERVRQLESMVRQLSGKLDQLTPSAGPNQPAPPSAPGEPGTPGGVGAGGAGAVSPETNNVPGVTGAAGNTGTVLGGSAAPRGPSAPPPSPRFNMPAANKNLPGKVRFGPGFEIATDDDEYQFQFHNLTQVDSRDYSNTSNAQLAEFRSTFGLPRQWWIFSGRLTKPFEYYVVPAFGFDNINLLDAFLNIHYDDRLQFKIGRYKTPFTYEFYNGPINAIIQPERSLFFNNYGLNRDVGLMAWGQLFQKKLDYAVGIFNGSRNFFIDRNDSKDIAAYVNFRPFGDWENTALENWNIGGSLDFGNQLQAPVPNILRTNVATTGSSFFGVPFLQFNNNVSESGDRALWALHSAWYYRQLSLIGEWQSGFQDYALNTTTNSLFGARTHLPIQSFYVQAGYFLTGETVSGRGAVRPIRDFDVRKGKWGPGAIELAARYSNLHLGNQVFTNGLADPNLWSNYAYLVDVGVNWYLTQYIKFYFGWQHSEFGRPVFLDVGRKQLTNDMAWARFQIYF